MKKTLKKTIELTEEEWARLQDLCKFSGQSRHKLIGGWIMTARKATS